MESFKYADLKKTLTKEPRPLPPSKGLVFGEQFADHMLTAEWHAEKGWSAPEIKPLENLSLHPGASVLHYGIELFEGMKAFCGVDGKARLFRPMENVKRLNSSAVTMCLPEVDSEEFLECLKELVRVDRRWIPKDEDCSLYIRPTYIGTQGALGVKKSKSALLYVVTCPVGPYFSSGLFSPVSLYANPKFVRSWIGGTGDAKIGGNYGPTIRIQEKASEKNCTQVLWLYGPDHQITEVGTMNMFVHWINEAGEPEIATPPLNGLILPGVVRKSLIELARQWGTHKVVEREVSMNQLIVALKEERVQEVFGSGTACVVCPVEEIQYLDEVLEIPTMQTGAKVAKRAYQELTDIQYGRTKHEWALLVE